MANILILLLYYWNEFKGAWLHYNMYLSGLLQDTSVAVLSVCSVVPVLCEIRAREHMVAPDMAGYMPGRLLGLDLVPKASRTQSIQAGQESQKTDWKAIHFSLSGLFWCLFCDICAVQMENCGAALQIAFFALPFLVSTNRADLAVAQWPTALRGNRCNTHMFTHADKNSCAYIFVRTFFFGILHSPSPHPTLQLTLQPQINTPTLGQTFNVVKVIQKVLTLLLQCTIWCSIHITYKHTHGD